MYGFIYYMVTLTINDTTWVDWAKKSALMVIHTMFLTLQTSDPFNKDNPLLIHKLEGWGRLKYHNTCMGWYIQKLSLWVLLTKGK